MKYKVTLFHQQKEDIIYLSSCCANYTQSMNVHICITKAVVPLVLLERSVCCLLITFLCVYVDFGLDYQLVNN